MPLYALTSKRIAKRVREDELGITALKAKLVESGELSDNGSGSGSGSEGEDEEDGAFDEDDEEEEDFDDDESDSSEDERSEGEGSGSNSDSAGGEVDEDSGSESGSDEDFPVTVQSALTDPLYPIEGGEEWEACVLCPGKVIKNGGMREAHLSSKNHKRSLKRYSERIKSLPSDSIATDDPRDIVEAIFEELQAAPTGPKMSKKSDQAAASPKATEKEGEGHPTRAKRKRLGRKARREEQALKMVQAATVGEREVPPREPENKKKRQKTTEQSEGGAAGEVKLDKKGDTAGPEAKGLNRKARRILAKQKSAKAVVVA